MPKLKTRMIFISHAWKYSEHYEKVVQWFNEEPNFEWKNCSVPKHDACEETTIKGLKKCLTNQIKPASVVVILAGMYAAYSEWIEYEIKEAHRMIKPIIGVKPWGNEKMPTIVQDYSDIVVGWNRGSIIRAVRELT